MRIQLLAVFSLLCLSLSTASLASASSKTVSESLQAIKREIQHIQQLTSKRASLSVLVNPETDFTLCAAGPTPDHVTVSTVTLIPAQVVRGQDEIVSFTGTSDEVVTGGTLHLTITFNGVLPVFDQVYNICDLHACPIQPGPISVSLTIPGASIPSVSPAGTYNAQAVGVDQAGNQLSCVDLSFNL